MRFGARFGERRMIPKIHGLEHDLVHEDNLKTKHELPHDLAHDKTQKNKPD
jgi:hypothetical protein